MANIGYCMINEVLESPREMSVIADKNGRVTIETILQDLEVKNRNGRWYGLNDFKGQLTCERTTELIRTKNFFGEAGHPMTTELSRQQNIDLNNIAHLVSKIWLEGNLVKAHTRGTPNMQGKLFNDLILEGTIPSFSLRALGTVENTKRGAEVKNIRLITYDWVVYPSHKKAYMQKILGESTDLGYNEDLSDSIKHLDIVNDNNKLIVDENSSTILPITNESVINYIKTESANLDSVINSLEFMYENISVIDNGTRVLLSDNQGQSFVVNLESYISNEILNYCYKR